MSGNKMALDALTAIVEADDAQCLEQSHIEQARAAIAALQAEPQPDEADLRQLMGMNEAEIDAELLAAGISPDDAVKRADRAIKGALATVRAERRAIEYGDIVHKQVVAMRAAVVAANLESPEVGIQWIANTLFGPGHYPDIEAARELGGAQALFDKESAELEAFRAAHPAPVAAQPSQAPVVQAGDANAPAVRMLTDDEQAAIIDMHSTGRAQGDHECAEAIQRKFCEVNGLPIPADGKIGGAA